MDAPALGAVEWPLVDWPLIDRGKMLSVSTVLPNGAVTGPPIVLVHGAANSAMVWTLWQRELASLGWVSHAIDLRGHGHSDPIDLSRTSMGDYVSDVRSLGRQLARRPVLVGWSMGGLIAMMVAVAGDVEACVALAPSVPARRVDGSVTLRTGEFGPEEYGVKSSDPEDQPGMPDLNLEERSIALASNGRESRLARDERKAGIVIESIACPLLIVTGTEDKLWPRERYDGLWLEAEYLGVKGESHVGLVLSGRAVSEAVPQVLEWVSANVQT